MKEPPEFPGEREHTAAQNKGIHYEAKVLAALERHFKHEAEVIQKPWLEFQDRRGRGICQPDCIILPHDEELSALVVEVKLTLKDEARRKLQLVYGRIARRIWTGRRWRFAQVTKNLVMGFPYRMLVPFDQILESQPEYVICHWR